MNTSFPLKSTKNRRSGFILPLAALGIAGTLYAARLNRRRKTVASSHSRMLEKVEQNANSITLAWKNQASLYRVFKGNELIYEDRASQFADQDLVPGTFYTYCIENLDHQGNVIERIRVQTMTSVDFKEKENILQDLLITTIIAKERISFEWEPIEGVSEYAIIRNGVKLDTIRCCTFTDSDISESEEYTYTIKAMRPLQRSDQMKWEIKSIVANMVGVIKKDSSTELAAKEEFSITKSVGSIQNLLKSPEEYKINPKQWQLRYTTFLKEGWLKNPNAISEDHFFKGDHRSFDPDSSHYRTRADVFIDMDDATALLSKETGITEAFNKQHEEIDSANASVEGIQLEKILTDDDRIKFHLRHSVSNPLVVSPAIDYFVCGTFYKDNEFDLVGIHDQAPEHEIYLKETGTDDWQALHQAYSKGLEMMADPMANHYWRYSTFTN